MVAPNTTQNGTVMEGTEIQKMMIETGAPEVVLLLSNHLIKLQIEADGFCDIFFVKAGGKCRTFSFDRQEAAAMALLVSLIEQPVTLDIVRMEKKKE